MALLFKLKSQLTAIDNLKKSIDNIFAWTKSWKIKIIDDKSVHLYSSAKPKTSKRY